MLKLRRFLRAGTFVVVAVLLLAVVLLFSRQFIVALNSSSLSREMARLLQVFQNEQDSLSKQREEIINSGILIDDLKQNDTAGLSAIIDAELKKRNLDFIVVTDKEGFVLARTGLAVKQGDNIFQTSLQGKNVALGETVNAVVRGVTYPLSLISHSYVFEQNRPIGSLLVGKNFTSVYADRFREESLESGQEILFYAAREGVVGDSLRDLEKTQLVNTYFSLGSDLVAQNLSGLSKEIKIDNAFYAMRHLKFPGLEESPGGAFFLFPINHSEYSMYVAGIFTLLLFVGYYFVFIFKTRRAPRHSFLMFALMGSISCAAIYVATVLKLNNSAIELKKSPYLIYNSTMQFEPETDVVSQSSEKTIAIKVVTGGEAINAVSAVIRYDPAEVSIHDITTANSFCDPSLFLEKVIDTEKREVRITCLIPSPGFSGLSGTVAELLVSPAGTQPFSLTFTPETEVLANDGLGTSVLRTVTNGFYQVVRQEFATADLENPIPIFSASHPNSTRWYNNKNVRLSWPTLSNGTYAYSLSHSPDSTPIEKMASTAMTELEVALDDGTHYFHLRGMDGNGHLGPVSTFKVMIDATPPQPPRIKASGTVVQEGDIVRLDFTSNDDLSGLQSGFYVKINEGILLPVKPPFYIPFLTADAYPLVIRVFDNANNFSDSSLVIHVTQ